MSPSSLSFSSSKTTTMEKSEGYRPIEQLDDPKSSSEMEDSMLLTGDTVPRQQRRFRPLVLLAGGLALVVYTLFVVAMTSKVAQKNRLYGSRMQNTLLDDYVEYENHVMEQWEDVDPSEPVYFADPSPEIDHNWHVLLQHLNIAVPRKVMEDLGRVDEGIEFPDGTFFASVMVYHHLHCLKTLYHLLHPEYYGMDKMTDEEKAKSREHTDHCLHMLKEAVMCQGDTTILTMKWAEYGALPIGNLTTPHECVNWDRLVEGAATMSVDVFANGMLTHPKFGPVFIDGQFAPVLSQK
ncbi:hypothetical protein F5X99DRAFT_404041 [Biscogniauxia marginata]|nr:hypothetical protein F5X99DRAFT_404041 [Biscogniauxia marginata]